MFKSLQRLSESSTMEESPQKVYRLIGQEFTHKDKNVFPHSIHPGQTSFGRINTLKNYVENTGNVATKTKGVLIYLMWEQAAVL